MGGGYPTSKSANEYLILTGSLNARWFLDCLCKFQWNASTETKKSTHYISSASEKDSFRFFVRTTASLALARWPTKTKPFTSNFRIRKDSGSEVRRPRSRCIHKARITLSPSETLVTKALLMTGLTDDQAVKFAHIGTIEELQKAEEGIQLAFRIWHSVTPSEASEDAYSNTSVD